MNLRTREETIAATNVELLDIESLPQLDQLKSCLIDKGFLSLHQVDSPDGTTLLCLNYKGIMVHIDYDEMVGARAKLIDLYAMGTTSEVLARIESVTI